MRHGALERNESANFPCALIHAISTVREFVLLFMVRDGLVHDLCSHSVCTTRDLSRWPASRPLACNQVVVPPAQPRNGRLQRVTHDTGFHLP